MENIDNEEKAVSGISEEAAEVIEEAADTAREVSETVQEEAVNMTETAAEETAETVQETAEEIQEAVTEEAEAVQELAEEAEEAATAEAEIVTEAVQEAGEAVQEAAEEIQEAVTEEAEAIAESEPAEAVQELAEEAQETGAETVILPDTAAGEPVEAQEAAEEQPAAVTEPEIPFEKTSEPEAPVKPDKKTPLLKNRKVQIGLGVLAIAIALAFIIPAYKKSQTYKKALEMVHSGQYQEAVDTLAEIEGYKDADQYSAYASGLKSFYDGDLEEAKESLETAGDLEDSSLYRSYIAGEEYMEEGYSTESYHKASEAFAEAGELLDSAGLAVYTQAISDFISGQWDDSYSGFKNVIQDNSIEQYYVDQAENVILYLDTRGKFNEGDYSVKDDFKTVAQNDDGLIGERPNEYISYIEGRELYDEGKFYSASRKFDAAGDVNDAYDLYNSCVQERPATGIVYNKHKSSAVSLIIYDTKDDNDMFVKIYDSDDKLIETLYIRDGAKATAKIPAGKHRLALGVGEAEDWYGTKEMWGGYGSYQRLMLDGSNQYYNFLNNYEYTLKFNVSEGGNVTHKYTDYNDA